MPGVCGEVDIFWLMCVPGENIWTLCGVIFGWWGGSNLGLIDFAFPTVYARDRGSPPLLTHVTVRVAIEDENDHAPAFGNAQLSLEVPEGQDPQTLTILRASDPDVGANGQLQYRIVGENSPLPTTPASTCLVLVPCFAAISFSPCVLVFPLLICSTFFTYISMYLAFLCLFLSLYLSPM